MRAVGHLAVALLLGLSLDAQNSAAPDKGPTKPSQHVVSAAFKPFVGTWKLISSEETLSDGTVRPYGFGPHPAGMLMYDAKGNMCAQVVNTDRPKWKDPDKPTADEIKTAFDGFGGYCGTYTVDESNSTMAHHPEIAVDPNLISQAKPRNYRFDGGHLIYSGTDTSPSGDSKWVMIWEKVK
jgi:hypothetical protein